MAIRVRTVRNTEELALAMRGIGHYFGWAPTAEQVEPMLSYLPLDRMHAALDDGRIVAGAGVFPFELTVPGGNQIDSAGVTAVGVLGTHRRRGIISEIMRRQLAEARDRGEPVAILIASESAIYGRFGYGVSSYLFDYEIYTHYRA